MAAGNQQKHLEFTFSINVFPFKSKASIRAHNLIPEMVKLLKIKRIFNETAFLLVSRTVKTRKFKLLSFRNETYFGAGNLYKDLFSIYLQSSLNKNS